MKVAYVLNSTDPLGGATKAFMSYLRQIMPLGVTPLVVVPDHKGIYQDLTEAGIITHVLNYRPQTYPKWNTVKNLILFFPRTIARIIANRYAAHKLVTILCNFHANLVHTNVSVINIGFIAAMKMGIPHLYHIREYGDKDFGLHYLPCKRVFLKQLSADKSYSVCITKDIQKHHHQDRNARSQVIYDSIREQVHQLSHSSLGTYFLYAGRIQYTKGLDILLRAYHTYLQSSSSKLHLYVAGDKAEQKYYQSMVDFTVRNNIQPYVHFLGGRSDIEALMQQAKALIIPSRYEGFGLCMPEAMFCGCLVIGHNTAGTKEQLDNGRELEGNEIALRFENEEQLANILLHTDSMTQEDIETYTTRAFHVVNQLYTTEVCAKKLYQYYKDIANETI